MANFLQNSFFVYFGKKITLKIHLLLIGGNKGFCVLRAIGRGLNLM